MSEPERSDAAPTLNAKCAKKLGLFYSAVLSGNLSVAGVRGLGFVGLEDREEGVLGKGECRSIGRGVVWVGVETLR